MTSRVRRFKAKANRGRAVAQENRSALLDAARRVFAERGYHAPLSAIAKEAGVGQAVLYRHFPTRLSLAHAVFETNLQKYEALLRRPGPRSLHRLWSRLCDDLIDSAAFVELIIDARRVASTSAAERVRAIVEVLLPAAREARTVPDDFDADELLLGLRMAYGIVVTSMGMSRAALRRLVRRALPLSRGRVVEKG